MVAPTHPITIALQKPIESYSLPVTDLLKIIGGVRQDLNHKPFASFIELESYSDHVAGAVGRLCARIFGDVRNKEVLTYATELGIACQLLIYCETFAIGKIEGCIFQWTYYKNTI